MLPLARHALRPLLPLSLTARMSSTTSNSSPSTAPPGLVGARIPSVPLHDGSPGTQVDLSTTLNSGVLLGVPAAFSPACSAQHVPGYIRHAAVREGKAGPVVVVAVNDAFAMKAWAETLDPEGKSGVRFLADPSGAFTAALHPSLLWSGGRAVFGNDRSKRYAVVVEDGKVKRAYVEPDNTGVDVSRAENVLG